MATTLEKRIRLHRAQMQFRRSDATYRGFVGGIGSGKSYVGAYDLLRRARPGRLYMAVAPTFPMIRDASLRTFLLHARDLHYLKGFARAEMTATLGNGAEVLFRSADDPERLRGPNLSGVWLDEASLMAREAYDITIGRLREQGDQGWLSATFTPKGRLHWTYTVFSGPDAALFKARTGDNPFLPGGFEARLRTQYNSLFAEQELGGEFLDTAGALFRRHWFAIEDAAPAKLSLVRAWDLAATEQKDNNDPDWTAGVLLGRDDGGTFWVIDVRHLRGTPRQVEELVRNTARQDGVAVPIVMEQEPGASGVALIDYYTRHVLQGYNFRPDRPTGDKVTRAQPLSAQAEAGNVKLVRAPWNKDFLDEIETFPLGAHDDQVDAASLALARLAIHVPPRLNAW